MSPIELAIVSLLAGGTTLLTTLFLLLGRRGRDPYEFLVEATSTLSTKFEDNAL